jgi:hypothetical protein
MGNPATTTFGCNPCFEFEKSFCCGFHRSSMEVDVDALAANSRHIAKYEAKPYPDPLPETAVTQGFEAFAFPKIVSPLNLSQAGPVWNAYIAACKYLHPAKRRYLSSSQSID